MAPEKRSGSSLLSGMGNRLSRARLYARWLRHEVPHDPRYEIYARSEARRNRAAFLAERAEGPQARIRKLEPFGNGEIPRIVWMYWHQGEEGAPFVVRRCIESWRRCNPGWEVRVLDGQSVAEAADMSDVPEVLPFRFRADLLRVRLLKQHGGVWADATVYCHRPLEEWLPLQTLTGFFAFRHPGPGRWIASWFMASTKGHPIPSAWEEAFTPYQRRLRYVPDMYFTFFYLLQWRLKRDPGLMAAWRRAPSLPAQAGLFMIETLRGNLPEDRLRAVLAQGVPVSKLSWKEGLEEAAFDSLCARLGTG